VSFERKNQIRETPAASFESDAFSKDLKRRGFSFVGSTVVYAHMQAVGMVNDHLVDRNLGLAGDICAHLSTKDQLFQRSTPKPGQKERAPGGLLS